MDDFARIIRSWEFEVLSDWIPTIPHSKSNALNLFSDHLCFARQKRINFVFLCFFVVKISASNTTGNDRCGRAVVAAVLVGAVRDERTIVNDGVAFERQRPVNHRVAGGMAVVFHLHAPGKSTPPVGS